MDQLRIGKLPAREGAVKFSLAHYLPQDALPPAPTAFDHHGLVTDWGMLANDSVGCCVFSGAGHETELWNAEAGKFVIFDARAVLSDYSAVTGYDPNDPNSDQGTDMEVAAKYRRKTGVLDAGGFRHKVGAYVALPGVRAHGDNDPAMLDTLASAAYLFAAIGVGIEFPSSAMDQFNNNQPWDVVNGSPIEGGHYIPVIGRLENGNYLCVTWGQVQEVTPAFLLKYVDEAIVYLSTEFLNGQGQSIDGFDLAALNADIAALGGSPVPNPAPSPSPAPTPTPTPAPNPAPNNPPAFPIREIAPWLKQWPVTHAAARAQGAIKKWLDEAGH